MEQRKEQWIEQAQSDLAMAKHVVDDTFYGLASFLAQQSAEKAFKACLIDAGKEVPKIHDLIELGMLVGLTGELLGRCEGLTLAYTETRYPDQFVQYGRQDAEQDIAVAEAVLKWVIEKTS